MAKYYLNNCEFKNQKLAIDYVREYLKSLMGLSIDNASEHWSFLEELVRRHPEYETQKCGPGIKLYRIGTNTKGDVELNLTWINDELMDISWITCVKGKSKSPETNLRCAMRVAIDDQIDKYKSKFYEGEECGEQIKDSDDWQVDHKIHFEKLVRDFLGKVKSYPKKFGDEPVTNKAIFKECDNEFKSRWQKEHSENAELRFLHSKCNLTRKKYKG